MLVKILLCKYLKIYQSEIIVLLKVIKKTSILLYMEAKYVESEGFEPPDL